MSGSYNELDVPPTLVSFCIGVADTNKVISNEFKKSNSKVMLLKTKLTDDYLPDIEDLKENYEIVHKLITEGKVLSVSTVKNNGLADVITKSAIGNKIGFEFELDKCLFRPRYGSFVLEMAEDVNMDKLQLLGHTIEDKKIILPQKEEMDLEELIKLWEEPLEKVFQTKTKQNTEKIENILSDKKCAIIAKEKFAKPRIFIPVFPGTNCEYDSAKAFEDAGGEANIVVFKNLKSQDIEDSIKAMEKEILKSQIIMFPGGFSAGDEPDGSGKFISAIFRNPRLKNAIDKHLNQNDGLILGICNGFQALIKLGLVPYGKIIEMQGEEPTLTFNQIARHQSKIVTTKVVSKLSPWFNNVKLGEEFAIPISHGEGRFVAKDDILKELIKNGQIATQYVDEKGNATYNIEYNPNGSTYAVEGITSKDGRILRKNGTFRKSI